MKLTARIGSILSWKDSEGDAPDSKVRIVADFDVTVRMKGQRHSKRFLNQVFNEQRKLPDIGAEVKVDFDPATGEISLL